MTVAEAHVRARAGRKVKLGARARRRRRAFYTFATPWLLGFALLTVLPLLGGLLTSMTNYDGLNLFNVDFVGLRNYANILKDPNARHGVNRTLLWSLLNLPAWLIGSFLLAVLVNRNVKGIGIFRTLLYLPSVIPGVALVWTWKIILEQNFGLLNGFLSLFRPGTGIGWLTKYALGGVTTIAVWNGLGAGMIIFLAGLQNIPEELAEAARIDGASNFQVFRYVTLPMMTPVIFYQLVLGLITAFQQLIIPLLVTTTAQQGVPVRGAYLYMIHVYQQIFATGRFGYGLALLWLLIIVIVALTGVVFATQRYWVYSEVGEA
jgi:multiple sugar transport system permease protein